MFIRQKVPWTTQPTAGVQIDWSNPITRGLVFCAVPSGETMIDLVTGVLGTPTGSTNVIKSSNNGKSPHVDGRALQTSGYTNFIAWPVSGDRGATMVQEATILVLGGTTEQVDGYQYCFAGNTEYVTSGHGFALGVDSYSVSNRGNIIKAFANGQKGYSAASLLGNPFDNRTHFFGYSATGNGASGNWFASGNATSYTAVTNGTTTTNRRAVVNAYSPVYTNAILKHECYTHMALFWDRAISPGEYKSLYDNPWKIFRP